MEIAHLITLSQISLHLSLLASGLRPPAQAKAHCYGPIGALQSGHGQNPRQSEWTFVQGVEPKDRPQQVVPYDKGT